MRREAWFLKLRVGGASGSSPANAALENSDLPPSMHDSHFRTYYLSHYSTQSATDPTNTQRATRKKRIQTRLPKPRPKKTVDDDDEANEQYHPEAAEMAKNLEYRSNRGSHGAS